MKSVYDLGIQINVCHCVHASVSVFRSACVCVCVQRSMLCVCNYPVFPVRLRHAVPQLPSELLRYHNNLLHIIQSWPVCM